MDTIGERLRVFAKERYGTLKAFGEAVELSPSQMTDYVKDRYPPGGALLQKFATAGLNVHWLLTGQGDMDAPRGIQPIDLSELRDVDVQTTVARTLEELAAMLQRDAEEKQKQQKPEEK